MSAAPEDLGPANGWSWNDGELRVEYEGGSFVEWRPSDPFAFTTINTGERDTEWTRNLTDAIESTEAELSKSRWVLAIGRHNLEWLAEFDMDCYEQKQSDPEFLVEDAYREIIGDEQQIEMLALGRQIADADPSFFPCLHMFGPTPAMIRRANNILCPDGVTAKYHEPVEAFRVLVDRRVVLGYYRPITPTRRGRAARRPCNARTRGSRRTTSRSAGGGSSGDDPGESEPPRLARWRHPVASRPLSTEAGR